MRVWDPLLCVLHGLLAAGVVLGWATTMVFGGWHRAVGDETFAVVGVRLV